MASRGFKDAGSSGAETNLGQWMCRKRYGEVAFRAKEQVERWEAVNEDHVRGLLKAAQNGKNIPRRVQRRFPNPARLYRRRKDRDRQRRNTCLVIEGVKRVDTHTLQIPGIGTVKVRERLDEEFRPRSCTAVERTTQDRARRLGRNMRGFDRAFEVHVQVRVGGRWCATV